MFGDTDSRKDRDSSDLDSPVAKKPKIDAEPEPEERTVPRGFWLAGERLIRIGKLDDPEYGRQRKVFDDQFEDSEGFDVDWDSFDYKFFAIKFEWADDLDNEMSNDELLRQLIDTAIKEHNEEEEDTNLEFLQYVSANVVPCNGYAYYITFRAQDLCSPNPQPKLYQTLVRKFSDTILVYGLRLRPTQE